MYALMSNQTPSPVFVFFFTDDHDEEEEHLFDQTIPLKDLILQGEVQFITKYSSQEKRVVFNIKAKILTWSLLGKLPLK